MPIPFRDSADNDQLGLAGYLHVAEVGDGVLRAALFTITSRSEPVEFTFNQVTMPAHFLWRPGDGRRAAVRILCRSLFEAATKVPVVMFARADEIPPRVFSEDITVAVPMCRVAKSAGVQAATETPERLTDDVHLFWTSEPPTEGSPARELVSLLVERDLLLEPFERAATGLEEALAQGG